MHTLLYQRGLAGNKIVSCGFLRMLHGYLELVHSSLVMAVLTVFLMLSLRCKEIQRVAFISYAKP